MWKSQTASRCHKVYPKVEDLNTRDYVLVGLELFGSTKRNLTCHLELIVIHMDPTKWTIAFLALTLTKLKDHVDDSLNYGEHDVAYTTSMWEANYVASHRHIARWFPSLAKRCWAKQANTCSLCNAKINIGEHDPPTPTYKELKFFCVPSAMWSTSFGFALTTSSFVWVTKKTKHVLDWHVIPNTWSMKINTNLSKVEVLVLKDVGF